MNFFKKKHKEKSNIQSKKQILHINPYENPENVLELMARICSAASSSDTKIYWDLIKDAYNKEINGKSLNDYLTSNRSNLLNIDFEHDLNDYCRLISWSLASRENTKHTQIVIAGGFSSGKSSFLNKLTDCTNLLPTGTEPVSVVKTYLYCSENTKNISVRGVNQKNVLVDLNTGVLQAIQHASKTNIYLASVLDKLFVEIPSKNLDGLVFIDTPGYNNTDKENDSNGKSDKQTALEALNEGQVLFWFIGCDRPTITTDDMDIIKRFNGRIVVIFNKADKIGKSESKRVVKEGARILFNEFDKEDIIDVIAFSSIENEIYYSFNNLSLSTIIKNAKSSGNGISELNGFKQKIEELFDDEIIASQHTINNHKKTYKQELKDKDKFQQIYNSEKDLQSDLTAEINNIIFNNYNDLMDKLNKLTEVSTTNLNQFYECLTAITSWDKKDHECWNNTLTPILNRFGNSYSSCYSRLDQARKYEYYEDSYRKSLVERVNNAGNGNVERYKEWYDELCNQCQDTLKAIKEEEQILRDMQNFKSSFMAALEMGIQMYYQKNVATSVYSDYTIPNIFETINNDDYKGFLHSFEDGVDLSICNTDGYNPLTLAVEKGNNMMVGFMLEHNADPEIKDNRGYNAFHTAVESQYRDICKMLLDVNPDLIFTKTDSGETVEELANKAMFCNWFKTELNNSL